jgi:D-3-phosphoglycerate dehydrogenase
MIRVLVADKLAQAGLDRLAGTAGVEFDVKPGMKEDELIGTVPDYDGMLIRSGVKITAKVLENPGKLRAIARAGVGVDNVDLPAATRSGVLVMNTPDANTISTAEHTMALLLAISRHVPAADAHVKSKQWKRAAFMGSQLSGKTLGLIGFGRVGKAVATRALSFGMKVIAYDPFFSAKSAIDGKVTMVQSVDELVEESDYLSAHCKMTDETRGMIGTAQYAKAKPGLRVVNCARGGIFDEAALAQALADGKVAAAGVDVYSSEPPAEDNPLLTAPNTVLTPHLGASTDEAQVAVSLDAVDALLDYLARDEIRFAVNVAGLPGQLTARDRAYLDLARRMGAILAPLCTGGIERVSLTSHGEAIEGLVGTMARQTLIELLSPHFSARLNMINVDEFAKQRGITVEHAGSSTSDTFTDNVVATVESRGGTHTIEGTVFVDGYPRILAIDNYRMDMIPEGPMVIVNNHDEPGVIGLVGTTFAQHKVNIADMTLARQQDTALILLKIDEAAPPEAIDALAAKSPPIKLVRTVMLPPATASK